MAAHAFDGPCLALLIDFALHVAFILAEAIANYPMARRQLLPHRHAQVVHTKDLSRV
jgi:hypothetical protein